MPKSREQKAAEKATAQGVADRFMFLGPVEVKPLFGGWCFRLDGITFAALMPEISFRGDASVSALWERQGGKQFTYTFPKTGRTTTMPYWRFSDVDLKDQSKLERLAQAALKIARAAKK